MIAKKSPFTSGGLSSLAAKRRALLEKPYKSHRGWYLNSLPAGVLPTTSCRVKKQKQRKKQARRALYSYVKLFIPFMNP